jgi:hypothetical protein
MKKLKSAKSIKATVLELEIDPDSYIGGLIVRVLTETAEIEYQNRCIKAIIEKDDRELLKLFQ